jgi:membrane fusion protein (multidrug efflux system)
MEMPAFIKKVPRQYLIAGVIVVVVLCAFVMYNLNSFEGTDDAFIDGHMAPVSAQVEGRVAEVLIKDNQIVKSGDILARIDDQDYTFKRNAAQADGLAAQAELQEAQKDQARYETLLSRQEISKQEFDHTSLRVRNAEAQAMRAQAKLDLAQLDLEHTKIIAPIDGRISARTVEQGQYVQAGEPLLSVVSSNVWVTANFKETQMKRMKPGNPVSIHVDAYPGVTFTGYVDSIQAGTGAAFSLLPAQNASGNYIKVVQRVPVKIILDKLDPKYPLWPGLSVNPRVDLRTIKG